MVLLQSRLGMARLNAFRLGWFLPYAWITIDGVDRSSAGVRLGTVQIVDNSRSTPSTCSMRVSGFVPSVGNSVSVGIGTADRLIFSGFITNVSQVIEGGNGTAADNIAYDITCQDQNWFLNRRDVFARYTNVDAAVAVADIISRFAPGFTTNHVFSGIGTITDITFAGDTVAEAISAIAALFGDVNCQWYVDYTSDIHFYVTDTVANPATVTAANTLSFLAETDLTQVRTRVYGKGASNPTTFAAPAGSTTVSVADTSIFSSAGGQFLTPDGQIVNYSSIDALGAPTAPTAALRTGGRATISTITRSGSTATVTTSAAHGYATGDQPTIAGVNQPEYNGQFTITVTGTTTFTYTVSGTPTTPASGTMSAFLDIGGALSIGAYQYKTTLIAASGETVASVASGSITVTAVAPPVGGSAAMVAGVSGNLGVGSYSYAFGFLTSSGQTLLGGGGSASVTAVATSNVSAASPTSGATGNLLPGNYFYKQTCVTAAGETLTGGGVLGTVTSLSVPGALSAAAASTTGNLYAGSYKYLVTFTTPSGETTAGSTTTQSIASVGNPSASAADVNAGGAMAVGTYYYKITYVTATGENTTGSYTTSITVQVGRNAVNLSSIGTGDARVTARNIYRSVVNGGSGGPYYYVATINNNTATTYQDTIADSSLGYLMFQFDYASYGQMSLTSIPTSADARVTGRKIYRTSLGGSVYKLLTTLSDNSTTTYSDNTPDASLGATVPLVDTASTGTMTVTMTTSADGRVTGRKLYRTKVSGSTYFLVATLSDNSTTSVVDNLDDGSLITAEPVTSTASTGQITLTSIPVSSDKRVIGRVVYRTSVGGSIYQRLTTLTDNTTTSYTDNTPDASLGDWASTIDTSGGSQMRITAIATSADPRVTGRRLYRTLAGGTDFYLLTTISDNTTVGFVDNIADSALSRTTAPAASTIVGLTGVPTSGTGAIVTDIPAGTAIRIFTQRDDLTAQAALALLEGGDGIHEHVLDDSTLDSVDALDATCDADLATFGSYEPKARYDTRDQNTVGGSVITISMAAPISVSGTYTGQSVTITEIGIVTSTPWVFPRRSVQAARTRFTLDDILRNVEMK